MRLVSTPALSLVSRCERVAGSGSATIDSSCSCRCHVVNGGSYRQRQNPTVTDTAGDALVLHASPSIIPSPTLTPKEWPHATSGGSIELAHDSRGLVRTCPRAKLAGERDVCVATLPARAAPTQAFDTREAVVGVDSRWPGRRSDRVTTHGRPPLLRSVASGAGGRLRARRDRRRIRTCQEDSPGQRSGVAPPLTRARLG